MRPALAAVLGARAARRRAAARAPRGGCARPPPPAAGRRRARPLLERDQHLVDEAARAPAARPPAHSADWPGCRVVVIGTSVVRDRDAARRRILDAAVRPDRPRRASTTSRIARIAMDAGVSAALRALPLRTARRPAGRGARALLRDAPATTRTRRGAGRRRTPPVRLAAMIDQCLPTPGELRDDWLLWVELWLRAARRPELRADRRRSTRACTSGSPRDRRGDGERRAAPTTTPALADRLLALIDGYGVRALVGDPAMPLERRARGDLGGDRRRDLSTRRAALQRRRPAPRSRRRRWTPPASPCAYSAHRRRWARRRGPARRCARRTRTSWWKPR